MKATDFLTLILRRTVATSLLFVLQSHAETVVVPNANADAPGPGAGASFPFNRLNARLQQIYAADQFGAATGGIIEISSLRFRVDETRPIGSSFSTVVPKLNIFMSTTSQTFATASTTFADNVQGELFEAVPAMDVAITGVRSSATSFDVVILLPNQYRYDRTIGNLIVDIRIPEGSELPFLDQQGFLPDQTFTVFGDIASGRGEKSTLGLITQFEYRVVPEPNTLLLLLFSLPLLVIKRKPLK